MRTIKKHNPKTKPEPKMKVQFKKAAKKGFSLVELLVVIAVIGIMAAIAIPMISNINERAQDSKDKRNAQNVASVVAAARIAGAGTTNAGPALAPGPLYQAVIGSGATGLTGTAFADTIFRVPNLAGDFKKYLKWESGELTYIPTKQGSDVANAPD